MVFNMDKVSHYAVIHYLDLKGRMPFHTVWLRSGMLNSNVAGSLKYHPVREGQSPSPETINKIHDIIMADRQVTEYFIATELGITQDCIHAVIHNAIWT